MTMDRAMFAAPMPQEEIRQITLRERDRGSEGKPRSAQSPGRRGLADEARCGPRALSGLFCSAQVQQSGSYARKLVTLDQAAF